MHTPSAQDAVFIDQVPDYQEAVKKITQLSGMKAPFEAAVHELGLDKELAQAKASLGTLEQKAGSLEAQENVLALTEVQLGKKTIQTAKDLLISGASTTAVSGLATGAIVLASRPKRWGLLKATIGAALAAGAAAMAWIPGARRIFDRSMAEQAATHKEALVNHTLGNQLLEQSTNIQDSFIAIMATRMLEQQKELAGEGEQMKLVSTAQPSTAPGPVSMAEKYAGSPASSKAAAIESEKAAAVAQAR